MRTNFKSRLWAAAAAEGWRSEGGVRVPPRPSRTDDKCKQIVGEASDEKETLLHVVGRKELLREFQGSL